LLLISKYLYRHVDNLNNLEHYLQAAPWTGKIMDVNIKIIVYTLLRYKAIPYKRIRVVWGHDQDLESLFDSLRVRYLGCRSRPATFGRIQIRDGKISLFFHITWN
jgi:hypothetical protein